MIRILVINTVRFKLNGIAAVIKNYYQTMNRDGLKMDFLAIDNPSSEYQSFFEENRCICYVVYKRNIIKYFLNIVKMCRKEKYDLVHIHGNSANMAVELMATMFGGVKNRIVHSHNTATLHPLTHKVLWPIFFALCTERLACGKDAGKWLYRGNKFTVLRNGIETRQYSFSEGKRSDFRKRLDIGANEVLLGHVGNFIEQKNHGFLIDIFAEIHKKNSKFKLLLISDGMLLHVMKEKVHALGLDESVIFLGKTIEVQNYLQAMDLFLLPSLYEGLPLVLIEAQAAGLKCVISDTVSRETDLTQTSIYLPIDTIEPWVNAISKERYHTDERKIISEANIIKIKKQGYDIGQNADELRRIYVKACGRKI